MTIMKKLLLAIVISSCAFAGIKRPDSAVYQTSTFGALLQGIVSGEMKLADLMKKGNHGLGFMSDCKGEMVAIDGQFYRFDDKGVPKVVKSSEKLSLATVTFFNGSKFQKVKKGTSFEALKNEIDSLIKNKNTPYAVRVKGTFAKVSLRNALTKEALLEKKVYHAEKVTGTLVGFWFPSYLSGVAQPGYVFQFISDDKKIGGHALEVNLSKGRVCVQEASEFSFAFPKVESFSTVNHSDDLTASIDAMEKVQ